MKYKNLYLKDFMSLESYRGLLKYFGSFDCQNRCEEIIDIVEDFEITVYVKNEITNEESYTQASFKKDFLLKGILKLTDTYMRNFHNERNEKGLFGDNQFEGYVKNRINYLRKVKKVVSSNEFLSKELRLRVLTEASKIEASLDNYWKNPFPEIEKKLKFNWNRTDVEFFFFLLRENGIINHLEDGDLGRIIDNICEFSQGEEIKDYKAIKMSRKHLNAWKNAEGRPDKNSISRLKKTFSNPDFYNI